MQSIGAMFTVPLQLGIVSGHGAVAFSLTEPSRIIPTPHAAHHLVAPSAATTVIDLATGIASAGRTVTYFGVPVVGFAAQSYSNGAIPNGSGTVLSNYGGQFNHKISRRIEVAP